VVLGRAVGRPDVRSRRHMPRSAGIALASRVLFSAEADLHRVKANGSNSPHYPVTITS